jgi:GNAT superfamily N-acetyltransferase
VSDPARLREIAFAAKAHWGYDEERVRAWADAIDLEDGREIFVAERDGGVVAWAAVIPQGEVCVLEDLWVDPPWMGRGVGAELFRRASERARELGATRMEWGAEPNAVGFYEKMGGRWIRDHVSEWGRVLPTMGLDLAERA